MYKIAVVGDYDSIFGFAALGLDTFAVQTREEAAEKLHQLAQGGFAAAGGTHQCHGFAGGNM